MSGGWGLGGGVGVGGGGVGISGTCCRVGGVRFGVLLLAGDGFLPGLGVPAKQWVR